MSMPYACISLNINTFVYIVFYNNVNQFILHVKSKCSCIQHNLNLHVCWQMKMRMYYNQEGVEVLISDIHAGKCG